MTEPLIFPGDEEVTVIDTDWLLDDCIMTLKERQKMEKKEMKKCEFCDTLAINSNIDEYAYSFIDADLCHDYTVALVIHSYKKGHKKECGRITDFRKNGLGYELNFCPECGRKLNDI